MAGLVYLLPLAFMTWMLGYVERRRGRAASDIEFVVSALPLLIMVALRGDAGTDTATYMAQFNERLNGNSGFEGAFEPGFEFLSQALLRLTSDARTAVNLISTLNAALFLVIVRKWGESSFASACLLLPAFYFDFTMNGLRIGTAFPLVVLSWMLFERRQVFFACGVLLLGISFQYSAALVFVVLAMPQVTRIRLTSNAVIALVLVGVSAFLFSSVIIERIIAKAAFYELLEKPSGSSGAAVVGFSILLALLTIKASMTSHHWRPMISAALALSLQLAAFGLTQITYAGIRFQLLLIFCQILFFLRDSVRVFKWSQLNYLLFLALWLMFAAWRVNSYFGEDPTLGSPFLPYKTLF